MLVVPSASKMMREIFGQVPCEEEWAMIHSEPLVERHKSQVMLQEDSQVLLTEASTLHIHKPCFYHSRAPCQLVAWQVWDLPGQCPSVSCCWPCSPDLRSWLMKTGRRLASLGTENGITSAAHSQCIQWPHSPCQSCSFLGHWMTFLKFQSFRESLEKLLCSARIPRGFLNGVSLLSKGIHSSFLFVSTNNCTCKFRLSNIVNSTLWIVRLTIPPPPLV